MALALPPAGHIWTIDPDVERTEVARGYLTRAGVEGKVDIINQPALDVLEMWAQRNIDIIFIDAEKAEYPAYLDLAIPMLKRSGLVILDNLLWGGQAGDEPSANDDDDLRAVRDFNRIFLAHPQLDATIIPIGDGIGIGARIE
jgi:predicted O-methyltransferase YrrM